MIFVLLLYIYFYTSLRSLLHFKRSVADQYRGDTISVKGPSIPEYIPLTRKSWKLSDPPPYPPLFFFFLLSRWPGKFLNDARDADGF